MVNESTVAGAARIQSLRRLSNHDIASKLEQLNAQKCALDAELILYLSELERRRLYREHACASLFEFCVTRLGCSEDTAYKRVGVARMLQQFPVVFELLANGSIHLTGLMLLKPHLTAANHQEWLLAASGKSKRQIEKLIAARFPQADVPTSVRKLPEGKQQSDTARSLAPNQPCAPGPTPTTPMVPAPVQPDPARTVGASETVGASGTVGKSPSGASNAARPPRMVPLSNRSYRVVFTASERLKQKLERASDLLSHVIPSNDLPAVIERALDQLLKREERRRYGAPAKPEPATSECQTPEPATSECQTPEPATSKCETLETQTPEWGMHSVCQKPAGSTSESQEPVPNLGMDQASSRARYVPASVRRRVFARDGGQCTFLDQLGRRCAQRRLLEFDHCEAFALGGPATVSNLRLRCRLCRARHKRHYAAYRIMPISAHDEGFTREKA